MKEQKVIRKGKEYMYRYMNYLSIYNQYKLQKLLMGSSFYKRFKVPPEEAKKRINGILKHVMDKVTIELTLGAKLNFENFTIEIDKRKTEKRTPTVKNGYLYIPVIKYTNKFARLKWAKHDVKPNIELQVRIRKAIQNNLYQNI